MSWISVFALVFLLPMAGATFGADVAVLLEACASIQDAQKRGLCVEEVGKLKPPEAAAAAPTGGVKRLNDRAYLCERFEFAELDRMSFDELEAVYCSPLVALDKQTARVEQIKHADRDRYASALRLNIAEMQRCRQIATPAFDLARRKFPDAKISCNGYQK